MKENNFKRFLEFLTTDTKPFRKAVLYLPLGVAVGMFFLKLLVRGETIPESLFAAGFIFLLVCFIGIVGAAVDRGKLR